MWRDSVRRVTRPTRCGIVLFMLGAGVLGGRSISVAGASSLPASGHSTTHPDYNCAARIANDKQEDLREARQHQLERGAVERKVDKNEPKNMSKAVHNREEAEERAAQRHMNYSWFVADQKENASERAWKSYCKFHDSERS